MGIAENIKARRLQLGLSQQELADKLGYKTRSTITKIESGENVVPETKLIKYAKALDTSVEYLKTGVESAFESAKTGMMGFGKRAVAVILAGGKSSRNQQNIPNQFINVMGKPIIIYSLEAYQRHPLIQDIYVVCLKGWEGILEAYAKQYGISKLRGIIPAGETGILSVRNGIKAIKCNPDDIIVLQESTRPLITEEIISKLLYSCKKAVAVCEPMDDYIQFIEKSGKYQYVERNKLLSLQSPEAYRYDMLQKVFEKGDKIRHDFTETCCAMLMYNLGYEMDFVEGNHNNIKVVRQEDVAILSAMLKFQM